MVIFDLFTKTVNITYRSNLLSKATLLVFIFGLITVVLPFVIAFKSRGLWIKRDVFSEQPDVKFKGEYIFLATTNNSLRPIITCSTFPYYTKTFEFLDTCSTIKVKEDDKNFDGKIEDFYFTLQVNLPFETELRSFSIVIALDYRLNGICPLEMQGAIIFHQILPGPVRSYVVVGEVNIVQSSPLVCLRNSVDSVYNSSIVTDLKKIDAYEITNIVMSYSTRNISSILKNIYTSFSPGLTNSFTLEMKVRYPEDIIRYQIRLFETIKWAWIQYYAIYVIISWIVGKLKYYIFNKRLVLFYEDNPLKKKQ